MSWLFRSSAASSMLLLSLGTMRLVTIIVIVVGCASTVTKKLQTAYIVQPVI